VECVNIGNLGYWSHPLSTARCALALWYTSQVKQSCTTTSDHRGRSECGKLSGGRYAFVPLLALSIIGRRIQTIKATAVYQDSFAQEELSSGFPRLVIQLPYLSSLSKPRTLSICRLLEPARIRSSNSRTSIVFLLFDMMFLPR
jgi:hypothetical protein